MPRRRVNPAPVAGEQQLTTPDGTPIPRQYTTMEGATVGYRPPPARRLRCFWHGAIQSGKTLFARSTPRTLICDFENKATSVPCSAEGNIAMFLETAADYEKLFDQLVKDAHAGNRFFDRIIFDVMAKYVMLVRVHMTGIKSAELKTTLRDITKWGKDGAGWDEVNVYVIQQLERLYRAGYAYSANSHIRRKLVKEGKETRVISLSAVTPVICDFLYSECEFAGVFIRGSKPVGRGLPPRDSYVLSLNPRENTLPTRQQLELKEQTLELPAVGGWQVFVDTYDRAVAAGIAEASDGTTAS